MPDYFHRADIPAGAAHFFPAPGTPNVLDKNVISSHTPLMATVVLTPEAVRDIAGLPAPIIARMDRLVERLQHWPGVSGAKRLRGDLAGKYRLRTGDYRLQFRIEHVRKTIKVRRIVKKKTVEEEKEIVEVKVVVEKAGHRDGFYEE
jgi:mRNA-degrading endonuclease RelE of RelBE toxin-antitoxin system